MKRMTTAPPSAATPDASTPDPLAGAIADQAAHHAVRAKAHVVRGCQHALKCGLRLIWLHDRAAVNGHANLLHGADPPGVSRETPGDGFAAALQRVGIARPTAYRWINATAAALVRAGHDPAELLGNTSPRLWRRLDRDLERIGAETSLSRLIMGGATTSSDPHRADHLISLAESGDERAAEIVAQVETGDLTWATAIRAYAGAIATAGAARRDPVYLDMDPTTGALKGLFPTSIKTLARAFKAWDTLPAPAREKARDLWLELVAAIPSDFAARKK